MNKKKKKKKSKLKRLIIFILFAILVIYFLKRINNTTIKSPLPELFNTDKYKSIEMDTNSNYSGKGQEKVNNGDGYFTTFTTEEKTKKTYIEYKQNGDASWASNKYWGRDNVR